MVEYNECMMNDLNIELIDSVIELLGTNIIFDGGEGKVVDFVVGIEGEWITPHTMWIHVDVPSRLLRLIHSLNMVMELHTRQRWSPHMKKQV